MHHFAYRGGVLHAEDVDLKALAEEVIAKRWPVTAILVVASVSISMVVGTLLGVIAARNQGKPVETVFRSGGMMMDTERHYVELDGQSVKLTPKEFDLLLLLVRNSGRVLTHKQILNTIWGPAHADDVQYLRVLVGQLRQKIELSPAEPALIITEPGIGYRFSET